MVKQKLKVIGKQERECAFCGKISIHDVLFDKEGSMKPIKKKKDLTFVEEMALMRKAQRMNAEDQDKTYFFGEVGRSRPKKRR